MGRSVVHKLFRRTKVKCLDHFKRDSTTSVVVMDGTMGTHGNVECNKVITVVVRPDETSGLINKKPAWHSESILECFFLFSKTLVKTYTKQQKQSKTR